MQTYIINGISFEYDERPCLDFYIDDGHGVFYDIKWHETLLALQNKEINLADFEHDLIMMDRWHKEVPRKRHYRKMILDGAHVISDEFWFDNLSDPEAEEVFTKLLNSAIVARKFLELFFPEVAEKCKQRHHPAEKYYIN